MKVSKKCSTITSYIVTCFLLGGFVCSGEAQGIISRRPENITVCRGSDGNISCGYLWASALPVTWIINGTSFNQSAIENSPLYQLNNPTTPMRVSLTIFSINDTTTVQCMVHSILSTLGIISVAKRPVIEITTATGGCGYVYVSWSVTDSDPDDGCSIGRFNVTLSSVDISVSVMSQISPHNFTGLPDDTLFNVTVIGIILTGTTVVNLAYTSLRTKTIERPVHIMITPNVSFIDNALMITVSWQAPQFTSCTANIIMYNITVMDQNSPASVTVSANMSSVEFSQFSADNKYNITVSAISDQGISYPIDSVVINTYVLQNCSVTSPSIGTIRVSCDSPHQILATVKCTNNCNNSIVTTISGSSPLTVGGLDPGIMYTVMINVFDGNQVALRGRVVTKTITVMSTTSSSSAIITSSTTPSTTPATTPTKTPATTPTKTTASTVTSTAATATESTASTTITTLTTIGTTTTVTTAVMTETIKTTTKTTETIATELTSGGSDSAGTIAGGVIGGIVVVIIIVIIIGVIYYFVVYKGRSKG